MSYKLVAIDLDGTLLHSDGTISDATLAALDAATARGVHIVFSTGRPMQGFFKYSPPLRPTTPVITCNGAMVVDAATRAVLYEQGLERADAAEILALGTERGATMCIWSQNRLYVSAQNEFADCYTSLNSVTPVCTTDFAPLLDAGITKILWSDTEARITDFANTLPRERLPQTTLCQTRPTFLEYFHRKVSKGAAIAALGAKLGVVREEIIAIGDERNDISMLTWAGLGVAMANAVPETLAAADMATTTNDEDGVLAVLKQFVL